MGFWCNKWLVIIFLLALEATFVWLAVWQFGRMEEKNQQTLALESAQNLPPLPLEEATVKDVGRRVQLAGWFDKKTVFLENQRNGEYVGYRVLSPFVSNTGMKLMVDRGWLPRRPLPPKPEDYAPAATPLYFTGILHTAPQAKGWVVGPTRGNSPHTFLRLDLDELLPSSLPFYVVSTVATHPKIVPSLPPQAVPAARHKGYMITWALLAFLLPILVFLRWKKA